MEENRLFKNIWRFNGIVIAIAGIGAIALMLLSGYVIVKEIIRERPVQNVVNIEGDSSVQENWRLGQFSTINGSEFIMVPLSSDQNFRQEYFSKSSSSIRNYLFLNTATSESKWLFNHTNYLIQSSNRLKLGDFDSNEPVLAILFYLVAIDSNDDGRLSTRDKMAVALSNPDGSGYKQVISDIDSVIGYTLLNERQLLFLYQQNGDFFTAKLVLASGELTNIVQVPKVGL